MIRISRSALAIAAGLMMLTATGPAMAAKKKVTEITCEEFLALGSDVQPRVVYWIEGFNRKGIPEEVTIDLGQFEQPVDALITSCQNEPQVKLWPQVTAYFHHNPDFAP